MSWSPSAAPERPPAGKPTDEPPGGQAPPARPTARIQLPRVHVGQLVCWQLAAVLGLAMIGGSALRITGLAFAAAALLAATAIHRHGRWAYQWAWLRLGLWGRKHIRSAAGDRAAPEAALLALLGPPGAGTVTEMTVDGAPVAVVEHAGGATAVLELGTADRPLGLQPTTLPSPAALLPHNDSQGLEVTIQMLVQVMPAPPVTAGGGLAAASYRELTGGGVPGRYHAWLAVQVLRTPRATPAELRGALAGMLRRLIRRLRKEPVAVRTLDLAGLRSALRAALHLDLTAPPEGDGGAGVERWDTWWTHDIPQASFHVTRWPERSGAAGPGLVSLLLTTECLATTVSLAARRVEPPAAGRPGPGAGAGADRFAVQLTARLAAPDAAALAAAAQQLQARLGEIGAGADRLDGRQLHGLAATLPLGGFLP